MNTSIVEISEIFSNSNRLFAPNYAAEYNFDAQNAIDYFDELILTSTTPMPNFSGILIVEQLGDEFMLIDGVQRIITISLLLCALCENYKGTSKKNETAQNKIFSKYLISKDKTKLLLNNNQEIFEKIIFSKKLTTSEENNNLYKTYKAFLKKIKSENLSGTELYKLISKIQFMVISIDKKESIGRELYLSLNKNRDDVQIKLINDFILEKKQSASLAWQLTINYFKKKKMKLAYFIKDFLTIQNDGKAPNENALYNSFKSYYSNMFKYQDDEKIIRNINKYANYYLKIVSEDFSDEQLKAKISFINNNNGKDTYSYLMEVLDDYENSHITDEMLLDILTMIGQFIQSRNERPITAAAIDFATLSKEINKMLAIENYTPSITQGHKLTINEINNLSSFEV